MSEDGRAAVWQRWVELHPYDADLPREAQDALLDTFEGRALALRIAAEPLGAEAVAMVDRMEARLDLIRSVGLRRALGAWLP